jgi:adenosine deaminase
MAHEAGLHLTSHAGEWGGAASVWQAIEDLRVVRIGHGVQAIEDPALVTELVAREIVLEVCPGSNVALGVANTLATHPIRALREAGVKVTVSTDDPPFFSTTMRQEYQSLAKVYDWTADDFRDLNATAAAAAFCDEATRGRVLEKLELP